MMCLVFAFLIATKVNVFAESSNSIYIQSENAINQTTIERAQKDWKFYADSLSQIENINVEVDSLYLGNPFTIENDANSAYFPLVDRVTEKIVYILTVGNNEQESITISKQFVEDLNSLNGYSSQKQFKLRLDDGNLSLAIDEVEPNDAATDIIQSLTSSVRQKRSVPDDKLPEYTTNFIPNWQIREQQFFAPWCMRYVFAAMINNSRGAEVTNAETLLKKQYPTATDEQLNDIEFVVKGYTSDAVKSMQKEYSYTMDMKSGMLNSDEVISQIDQEKPIYVSLTDITPDNPEYGHAVSLIGYVKKGSSPADVYYYIWNPWWNKIMLTNAGNMKSLNLGLKKYSWDSSGLNFRKEPVKVSENPMTMTEVSKTVMVNTQPKSIDSLPWGRQGYVKIDNSTNHTGKVVTLTQDAGLYAYSPDLKGWIDKKGVTEVIATNISTKVEKAGFSIDPIPWQSGVQHIGYTKDHINQAVTITARQGSYYYVPSLGWIDKKAFNANTQSQVDAVKSSNTVTNTKWTIKNTENHLTVLNNGKSIDTLPWGKKGFKNLGNVNTYANQYIHITQDAGSYVYSPELKGWVDKKGLSSN